MELARIVSELKRERERLDQAISLLEGATAAAVALPKRRHITPEGRKRLSELMKKRWAERRRNGNGRKAQPKAA